MMLDQGKKKRVISDIPLAKILKVSYNNLAKREQRLPRHQA